MAALAVLTLVFAVAVVVLFALPASAPASDAQQSILQDDDQIIYASPAHEVRTLKTIAALGVDRVKVSVVWWLVAPRPNSTHRPRFNASNPGAYAAGAWARYDLLVRTAQQLGLKVYFSLSPPSPAWALPRGQSTTQGPVLGRVPDTGQFRAFVEAIGRRYSGTFKPAGQSSPLPRVDYWGVWNEPNERSWLNPWWAPLPGGKRAYTQPAAYRRLVNAAWTALHVTGHGGDTFLIGETANEGILNPVPFARAMYCVGANDHPLHGAAAAAYECPTSGNRSKFVRSNPGLFHASGYAHHPYSFDVPPNHRYPVHTYITLYNIASLERDLNRIWGAYGKKPSGGVPIYVTEWGYKTNPPNPYVHTSLSEQATWLDQGEYMTWLDPYVHALAQFLLVDDKPKAHTVKGSQLYWSTWQTGLEYHDGTPKPSYEAFRLPIWLPDQRHGSSVAVWGQLRPANHTTTQTAQIQLQSSGSSTWTTLTTVSTTDPEGFFLTHVAIPTSGQVRLAWTDPATGAVDYSRDVSVS